MTFGIVALIIAFGVGFVTCAGIFVAFNITKPDRVDKVEGDVRDAANKARSVAERLRK